ncbi:unnamed protein product [Chondrus crispus]|uniref:Uncharacterized protein n=1 Tax=Chondrus crispus TaxID=2769 RepID=R7QM85_CHOCR|nr:unnamed protein product [Chondrus crispus]CDF39617.1 unnamed protein product [Chondrus crispus]|eukprot:XP_005709911.1 unnamed protein product [Chondrus crispus]
MDSPRSCASVLCRCASSTLYATKGSSTITSVANASSNECNACKTRRGSRLPAPAHTSSSLARSANVRPVVVEEASSALFWRIWETLLNIRMATLQPYYFRGSSIEPRVLDRLKALESVRIKDMLEHAALLGPVVTSISDRFQRSGDEPSIRALSKCVGLSDLRLSLRPDDRGLRALNHAVHFMPVLKYLSLRWACDLQGTNFLKCRYIKTVQNGNISTYVAVFPEFHVETVESVMQLVRQTPALESLELLDVRIPTEGVVDVLRHLGNRLKHFGVSLSGQADSSFERLQILIATICKYNCRLESVSSGLWGTAANAFSLQNVKRVHLSEANVGLLEERKGKLDEMLRSVSRWVPFLNPSSLKSWLDDVSWIEVK